MLKLNNAELKAKVNEALDAINFNDIYECEYEFIGIRFENKLRTVGEIIEDCSRDNEGRDDERDFPEYGTDEYEEMEELDGISTWDCHFWEDGNIEYGEHTWFDCKHIYIIGGNTASPGPDDNELIIEGGEVLAVIV
jgi:hypothetical protein